MLFEDRSATFPSKHANLTCQLPLKLKFASNQLLNTLHDPKLEFKFYEQVFPIIILTFIQANGTK
jgi:hypothetical protein